MYISELTLRNFKLFTTDELHIDFSSKARAYIFLGDNGCGKSSVLQALSLQLSVFLGQFPGSSELQLPEDAIHIKENNRLGDYMKVESSFEIEDEIHIPVTRYRRGSMAAPGASDVKELKAYAGKLRNNIEENTAPVVLPIIAHYGTERGRIQAPERKRNFKKSFARWDGYINALTPQTDFKTFFAWFDLKEDEERRLREDLWQRGFTLPELDAVRTALERFVGDNYYAPQIKLHPLRFVMHQRNTKRELRLEQLSDGYRIIIAMIADIASRMAELNPSDNVEEILSTPGIIMIDEVDLHLHPSWQRKIVSQLIRTFPKVQFILTSHSPLVALDAPGEIQIFHIHSTGADENEYNLETSDVNEVLLSNLFGLPSVQTPKWDEYIERRDQLLSQPELSAAERSELTDLEETLSRLDTRMSTESREISELLHKIASKMGLDDKSND